MRACMCAKLLQSCLTLCDLKDYILLGSSVRGILQARILEWVAMPSSRVSSQHGYRTCVSNVSFTGRQFFTTSATLEALIINTSMYPFFILQERRISEGFLPGAWCDRACSFASHAADWGLCQGGLGGQSGWVWADWSVEGLV